MTKPERDAVKAEYAELFGADSLALALKCRKSVAWMQNANGNQRVSRARCQAIRDQTVQPNANLRTFR
jgi:hypothetical protein